MKSVYGNDNNICLKKKNNGHGQCFLHKKQELTHPETQKQQYSENGLELKAESLCGPL